MSPNPTLAELEVFMAAVDGGRHGAASRLGISEDTAKSHLASLYRRLGVRTRTQALVVLWPIVGDHVLPGVGLPAGSPRRRRSG